jgi:DNA-directed RNA polymerase subunit RPC12/RpoP
MNFKPALCPSCGGKMQMPDNVNAVKCMYCGVEVIVKEAIRLAGRVKEFTEATAVEKDNKWKPFNIERAKQQNYNMIFVIGGLGIVSSLCIGSFEIKLGIYSSSLSRYFAYYLQNLVKKPHQNSGSR